MNSEELFYIIKSLTHQQRVKFRNWIRCNSKGSPNYLLLYERLSESDFYDDIFIRGSELLDSKKFYKARIELFETLISALSKTSEGSNETISKLEIALSFGSIDWVRNRLSKEIKKNAEVENFRDLKRLVQLRDSAFQDHGIELILGENLGVLRAKIKTVDQLAFYHEEVIEKLLSPLDERERFSIFLDKILSQIKPSSKTERYWLARLKADRKLLSGDYNSASKIQIEIVESLLKDEFRCSSARKGREIGAGIRSCLFLGMHSKISNYSLRLSQIEPNSRLEELEKQKIWIARQVEIGDAYFSMDHLSHGFNLLLENLPLFSERLQVAYLYTCANAFFILGDFKSSSKAIAQIKSIPKKHWGQFTWQPELLWTFILLEINEIDHIEGNLRSIIRSAKSTGQKYPILATKAISDMLRGDKNHSRKQSLIKELALLKNVPSEYRLMNFFDLECWLVSKIKNVSLKIVHEEISGKSSQMLISTKSAG